MKVICINGIRTDGASSTKRFCSALNDLGIEAIEIDYPMVNIFQARSRKRQRKNAQYLLDVYNKGDIVVAHSYGCLVTLRAMELGARFSTVFYYAPAMNRDFVFPFHGMEKLYIIHNKTDEAIKWGDRLWFGHDFGKMGSHGYSVPPISPEDERITNIEDKTGIKNERNHSHYFNKKNLPQEIKRFIALTQLRTEKCN